MVVAGAVALNIYTYKYLFYALSLLLRRGVLRSSGEVSYALSPVAPTCWIPLCTRAWVPSPASRRFVKDLKLS